MCVGAGCLEMIEHQVQELGVCGIWVFRRIEHHVQELGVCVWESWVFRRIEHHVQELRI